MDELAAAAAVLAMDVGPDADEETVQENSSGACAAAMFSNSLLRAYRWLERRTRSVVLNNGNPGLTSIR